MGLPRAQSVGVGLATMAGVWVIYQNSLPPVADIRTGANNDPDASAAEKRARWTAAAVVVGVSVLTGDATVFVMGGLAIILESWAHRHANAFDPTSRSIQVPPPRAGVFAGLKVSAQADAGV